MEKKQYELNIDEELEGLIPPLQDTELKLLTESLLENGCEMPLVVWDGTIVDGHNRYRICREHGIPFAVEEKHFESRDAAKIWLIKNQLGRRNLPDFVRCELVIPMEELLKEQAEKRMLLGKRTPNPVPNLAQGTGKTRDALASIAGVSHGTMDKAKKIIASADEETKDKLRKGEVSINKAYTEMRAAENPKPSTATLAGDTAPIAPAKPAEPDTQETGNPQRQEPEKPKYTSLLDKPIFDRGQLPRIDHPILFQPLASRAATEDVQENCGNDVAPDVEESSGTAGDEVVSVEEDLRELIDEYLEELSEVLDGMDQSDASQILKMVEDAGARAVAIVKTRVEKMEERK